VSYLTINRVRGAAEWEGHTKEVISALHLLLADVTDVESAQRGFAIVADENFLERYKIARREIGLDLHSLRELTADNAAQQRRLDVLAPLVAKRMARLDDEVELRRGQGFATAQAATATGVGRKLHDEIQKLVGEMEAVEDGLLQQREVEAKRSSEMAKAIIVVGSLLALAVVAFALFAVGKDFDRRRTYLAQAKLAARLARLGAWKIELPGFEVTWSDEICVILEVPLGFVPTHEAGIDFYAPEYRGAIQGAIEACVRGGTPFDLELQLISAKGRRVWVRAIGEAERDAKGLIRRVQGAFQDVTARKQSDEALLRQQTELRVLFDLMPAMIWFKDAKDGILRVNQRVADLAGKSISEIEGKSALEIYPREAAKFYADDVAVMRLGVAKLGNVEAIVDREGKEVWLQTDKVPVFDREGKVSGIVVMAQDITVRKQGQEALHKSEMQFRQVVENIDEVFWIMDVVKNVMLYVSPAYAKIWGRSCESLCADQRTWLESVHPEERERVGQAQAAKYTSGDYDETFRIIRSDGTMRWIHSRAFPVHEKTGEIHRVVGVSEDITKYRTMEEQFRQSQKMEAVGTLAGGIAHDFNNILASISGYTELSQIKLKENPEVREFLGAVLKASSRAADLIRQILMFSRQQPLERLSMRLHSIVAESIALLRATLPATIEFDTSLATDAPTVLADATQIHQILMNLGTNAWHAMKEHPGRLQVKLEKCVVDAAYASTHPRLRVGVYARLSVSDTGSGMDPARLQRIFEPFFTTKPIGEGTGLGLAVVHGIMDSHDGVITVYSQPGEGTVFHLYFPAHAGEETASTIAEDTMPRGHGERVLFVDDEELLALLGQEILAALGYDVEFTTQPLAALAMVRANPSRFALVLTDQTMPEMTGLTLADHLQKVRPGLPIILTTGNGLSLTPARLAAAGVLQLLPKPTALHSLAMAVKSALNAQVPGQ